MVFPQAEVVRICALARERGLATFLDGARLWNASVASGLPEGELAAPFDLVAVSFSKGLGAPGGSLLAGSRALIAAATRHRPHARRRHAPVRHSSPPRRATALEHHRARLADDHANARALAERARDERARAPRPRDGADQHRRLPSAARRGVDARRWSRAPRARGVLVNAFDARTVRAVTHLDVSAAQVERAGERLLDLLAP